MGAARKQNTLNFPKNKTFLTYMCAYQGEKIFVFQKFGGLCFPVTSS